MVGGTIVNRRPEPIRGDAAVVYDLGRSAVNVSFTNIRNIGRNTPLGNMGWSGIPVSLDGSFRQSGASGDVEGTFYGSAHAEVGGIFSGRDSLGAFRGETVTATVRCEWWGGRGLAGRPVLSPPNQRRRRVMAITVDDLEQKMDDLEHQMDDRLATINRSFQTLEQKVTTLEQQIRRLENLIHSR